jgi:hypothetical protein
MLRADWVALSIGLCVARPIWASDTPPKIYSKSGRKRFLHEHVFKVEFLFLETVDEAGIWQWPVFFSLQFIFQFGMFDAERGHVTVVHLILLL